MKKETIYSLRCLGCGRVFIDAYLPDREGSEAMPGAWDEQEGWKPLCLCGHGRFTIA